MAKLTALALVVAVLTLALTVHILVKLYTHEISLYEIVTEVTRSSTAACAVSCPVLGVVGFVLSLLAKREAESYIDTALTQFEEYQGKLSLALAYTALGLIVSSFVLMGVGLVVNFSL